MALAGSTPSTSGRREFTKMASEKQAAFSQAWIAMATEAFRANQSIATLLFSGSLFPHSRAKATPARISRKMQSAANSIVSKGLAPVHRTAVANAKRHASTADPDLTANRADLNCRRKRHSARPQVNRLEGHSSITVNAINENGFGVRAQI